MLHPGPATQPIEIVDEPTSPAAQDLAPPRSSQGPSTHTVVPGACIDIYLDIYICTYTCMHACIHQNVYVHMCIYIQIHNTHVSLSLYIYIYESVYFILLFLRNDLVATKAHSPKGSGWSNLDQIHYSPCWLKPGGDWPSNSLDSKYVHETYFGALSR